MQKIINCGIYSIKSSRKNTDEKAKKHPCLVIKTLMLNLYYVIPLISFTEERWAKYKTQYACRIQSTDSIALISKMYVRYRSYLGIRFVSNNIIPSTLIVPTHDEIELVLTYLNTYFYKSINDASIAYRQYYKQYALLSDECKGFEAMLANLDFEKTIFRIYRIRKSKLSLKIDDDHVGLLSGKDIQWILSKHISTRFSVSHYFDYYLITFDL